MGDDAVSAKPRPTKPAGPSSLNMVLAAITAIDDRKGATVPAIKHYILSHYPTVDPSMLRTRLRKALEKGFTEGLIVRPKSAEAKGPSLSGRFKLNKVKITATEKVKKAKIPKEKVTKTTAKSKETKPPAKSPSKKVLKIKAKPDVKGALSPKKKAISKQTTKKIIQAKPVTKGKAKIKQPKTKSMDVVKAKTPRTPKSKAKLKSAKK